MEAVDLKVLKGVLRLLSWYFAIPLSHLVFADDVLVFPRTEAKSLEAIEAEFANLLVSILTSRRLGCTSSNHAQIRKELAEDFAHDWWSWNELKA